MRIEDMIHRDYRSDPLQMMGAGFAGNGGQAGAMNMYHPGTAGPYNNSSLNRKLAAAEEWLKQRRSK